MSTCNCRDRLEIEDRFLVRGETIHTQIGCFHASLFHGTEGERHLAAALRERAERAEAELLSAREALREAHELLRLLEWHRLPNSMDSEKCPICQGLGGWGGHKQDCRLARALSPSPKGTPNGEGA